MDGCTAVVSRRHALAGGLCACLSGLARAEAAPSPPSGAVALTCTRGGLAGMMFEGEEGATLSPDHRWHVGSNTKAMTAALYARLVDAGRCRWGATVRDLFPAASAHPAWAEARVEDLLGHVAGLTDGIVDPAWLGERHRDRTPPREQRRLLVERILARAPDAARGGFRYGNLNYVLVGAAIEEATGASWEDAMRAELLAPLGMRAVGFGAPPRAGPWGREGDGAAPRPVDPDGIADNPAVLWPSGGVHLSPADYAGFLSLFLRDGAPLLRRETLDHLLRPVRPDLRYAGGWSLADAAGGTLSHSGSNTLWFATARVERAEGRAYAAIVNRGGERGAATTARLIRALRSRPGAAANPN